MSHIRNTVSLAALALASMALLGCATVPPAQRDSRDPW